MFYDVMITGSTFFLGSLRYVGSAAGDARHATGRCPPA